MLGSVFLTHGAYLLQNRVIGPRRPPEESFRGTDDRSPIAIVFQYPFRNPADLPFPGLHGVAPGALVLYRLGDEYLCLSCSHQRRVTA